MTPIRIKQLIQWRPGKLAGNALANTFWQMARLGLQLASLVIIARILGPKGYGALTGYGGIAVILGGLTGFGGGVLLLQNVSRQPETFGRCWYATLRIITLSSLVLLLVYLLITPQLLKLHLAFGSLLAIALSEILCYPLVYAAGYAFQAHERLAWASALPASMAFLRLLGTGIFGQYGAGTLENYLLYHFATSVMGALISLLIVQRLLQPKLQHRPYSWQELRLGFSFASNNISTSFFSEMDKILAVRYLGAGVAGSYTAAYRLIGVLLTPVLSLMQAAQPRLFRHDGTDNKTLHRLLLLLTLTILVYGSFSAVFVWSIAPWLTWLLGESFAAAIDTARLLAPLLPLMCLRLAASMVLTSLGSPAIRTRLEIMGIVILGTGLLIAMPRYGLTGTVLVLGLTETLLLMGLTTAILKKGVHQLGNPK